MRTAVLEGSRPVLDWYGKQAPHHAVTLRYARKHVPMLTACACGFGAENGLRPWEWREHVGIAEVGEVVAQAAREEVLAAKFTTERAAALAAYPRAEWATEESKAKGLAEYMAEADWEGKYMKAQGQIARLQMALGAVASGQCAPKSAQEYALAALRDV